MTLENGRTCYRTSGKRMHNIIIECTAEQKKISKFLYKINKKIMKTFKEKASNPMEKWNCNPTLGVERKKETYRTIYRCYDIFFYS